MTTATRRLGTMLMALALAGGCGDDKKDPMPTGDNNGGTNNGNTEGNNGDDEDGGSASNNNGGGDGGPVASKCPAVGSRKTETVTGDITADATWDCKTTYLLDGRVYVKGGTLKIGPGTVIQGDVNSALIVTSSAKLESVGTAVEPVLFTSIQAKGTRKPSDWQGVVLLGKAKTNRTGGSNLFEGLDDLPENRYGGDDTKHNCGTIKYTRIEFAGYEILPTKELNGLSLGGCGSDTTLDYIHIHQSADDAIEFFGGSANVKHLVASSYDDDGLDWDEGWSGNAQFIALQQPVNPSEDDPNGFEGDNQAQNNAASPVSNPTVYNATIIGGDSAKSAGMVIRRGTKGTIKNFVLQGFKLGAIDVRDSLTAANANDGSLNISNGVVFGCGADGNTNFPLDDNEDADKTMSDSFDDNAFFTAADRKITIADPKLGDAASRTKPNFVPAADSPAKDGGDTPPSGAFWDTTATYRGAFEPGGTDWTKGWTDYPAN